MQYKLVNLWELRWNVTVVWLCLKLLQNTEVFVTYGVGVLRPRTYTFVFIIMVHVIHDVLPVDPTHPLHP